MRVFTYSLSIIITFFLFLSCGTESTPTYTLATSVVGEGSITPSGGTYEEGETVTLTSSPSQHWVFDNWSGDGIGSSSTVTITMDSDKSVVGNFSERLYPLNITIEGEGTVEQEVIQSKSEHLFGTVIQLTANPSNGWKFVEWSGGVSSTDEVVTVTVDGEVNITVTFERIDYPLTITIEGEGTVEQEVVQAKTTDYPYETVVSLTATPADGWEFTGWGGDIQGDQNPVVIEVDRNKEVVAMFLGRPSVSTNEFSEIESTSAVSGGSVTDDGGASVTARGVCLSTSQNPTMDNSCTSDGTGTGSYTSSLNNLNPDTRYYVRAYASNSVGTAYGDQREFRTQVQVSLPTVSTSSISSITQTSAVSGGSVTDDGGASVTARGVCLSTSQNPTMDNSCTTDGSGIGSFSSSLSGLSASRTYFVRAYATNSAGTAYGNQLEFRTLEPNRPRDTQTAVVEVTSATGRIWMDRNLGASRRATSSNDSQAYGDLYQWGRGADGHQKRNSATTSTLSNSNQPDHGSFILSNSGANWDWRSPQNHNLWQGVNGVNNPCPDGYRLPTQAEWDAERQSWSSSNASGAFNSPLKLPVAGRRVFSSGSLLDVGSYGLFWSGTVAGTYSRFLDFNSSNAFMVSYGRAFGLSVRCIKD